MSIYDALDAIPTGHVAVSVDIPGWALVNMDTGKVVQLYVERDDLSNVIVRDVAFDCELHPDHDQDGDPNVVTVPNRRRPLFEEEVGDATLKKAREIVENTDLPPLEYLR